MGTRVFFGEPEVVSYTVEGQQLQAAVELVDGEGIRAGSAASAKLIDLMHLVTAHKLGGESLPAPIELRFAELVLLLAASSADPQGGGG